MDHLCYIRCIRYAPNRRDRNMATIPQLTPKQSDSQETARLVLLRMGSLGDCVASFEDQEINVFGGIPGEEVIASIIRFKRRRKLYVSAFVIDVLEPSPHRVTPPCGYFGACTGCQWQHIEYSHQIDLKRDSVREQLAGYPVLANVDVSPTVPCEDEFYYRNHARFTVRRQGSLGYVNRITRRYERIDKCMLMTPGINRILGQIQDRCAETTQLSIRYGVNTGDFLIQPTMQNPDLPVPSGQTHYREKLSDRPFRIASPSFFQVNTRQAERMIEMIRDRLELTGDELLVDAYAGVGTFAVLLAQYAREVVAIEESPAAVKDAAINTLGLDNLKYVEGKTEHVLLNMTQTPDAVILDPPRVGCYPGTLEALVTRPPRKVVYVSCDPESLARDLDVLVRGGFKITSVEPVDMFPQTYHVECITILESEG